MVTAILPALGKAKAKANRMKCANNLKQITQCFYEFASDADGAFPWHYPEFAKGDHVAKAYGANNPKDIYNVETIWRLYSLRQGLVYYASLASPCDPAVVAQQKKHKIKTFDEHRERTDFIVPRQMQSYAIHMGGDLKVQDTILATTRNFDGDDAVPTKKPAGDRITPKYGRSLRFKNLKNAHFIGTDEASHSRVMGGLNSRQGNLANAGGAVMQGNDADLHDTMRRHANSWQGGDAITLDENLSRPRQ